MVVCGHIDLQTGGYHNINYDNTYTTKQKVAILTIPYHGETTKKKSSKGKKKKEKITTDDDTGNDAAESGTFDTIMGSLQSMMGDMMKQYVVMDIKFLQLIVRLVWNV